MFGIDDFISDFFVMTSHNEIMPPWMEHRIKNDKSLVAAATALMGRNNNSTSKGNSTILPMPHILQRTSSDKGASLASSFFSKFMPKDKSSSTSSNPLLDIHRSNTANQIIDSPKSIVFLDDKNSADKKGIEKGEGENSSVFNYELTPIEKNNNSCVRGSITLLLRYDFIHRVLMVHLKKANNLSLGDRIVLDPYIIIYLLPDRRHHCKTRIVKKTVDPEYNEMFSFDVQYNNLSNNMLQFTLYSFDRFTKQIGNVVMRDLFEKSDLYMWTEYTMPVMGSQEKNDFGDLLLYITYSISEQKLYVTVGKAYNLRPMDITGASDPYCKVDQIYHGKRVKQRKSTIKRANLNPVYNETLEFDLPLHEVRDTNFLVQVMDWDRIGRDDLLGFCILGKDSPTAEGFNQWSDCFSFLDATKFKSFNNTIANGNIVIQNNSHGPEVVASPTSVNSNPPQLSASLNTDGYFSTKSFGTWHSIQEDIPPNFRNIPKSKKNK
uniref:C2 domain-containing protein n=1 Tax=Rhabditophanes sp. KR3021 TaxID=114890 RepID=A0AC35TVZ5_9BILA